MENVSDKEKSSIFDVSKYIVPLLCYKWDISLKKLLFDINDNKWHNIVCKFEAYIQTTARET